MINWVLGTKMKFSSENTTTNTYFGIEITDYCGKNNPFHIDCAIAKFRNGKYPWKINHNYEEMFFVLDGDFTIDLENDTIILKKNDVYIMQSGVKHCVHSIDADVLIACTPPFNMKNIEFLGSEI